MRLLIHAVGISRGGGFRHLAGFIPALAQHVPTRGKVYFAVQSTVARLLGPPTEAIEFAPFPDRLGSHPAGRIVFDNLWIPRLAKKLGVDAVVSFGNFGPALMDLPHVVFQTNATFFDSTQTATATLLLRRELAKTTMRSADLVVVPSCAMADLVGHAVPRLRAPIAVLPHGTRLEEFHIPVREQAKREGGSLRFLCPGIAAPYKGLDVVVAALPLLRDHPVSVAAYGDEADWPRGIRQARKAARELRMDHQFALYPEVAGHMMPALYKGADAVLYPTRCESFGFTLLEALAAGLPVVASDLAVNREIAGDAAIYYKVDSPCDLAESVARLARDSDLRQELSNKAVRRVASFDWSWQRYARDFWKACEGALR